MCVSECVYVCVHIIGALVDFTTLLKACDLTPVISANE